MAKVTGPLMSMSASGSIGKAITFAAWKGTSYVRELVIPHNPQSNDQGDVRLVLGGTAKAAAKVSVAGDYNGQLETLNKVPSGQSKQSFLVRYIIDNYMADATAFEAIYTAFEAHTAKADFTSSAGGIGLEDFDVSYKGTAHTYSKGMMLYILARAAIGLGFTGEPYTTAIASWDAAKITAMVADL